MDEKLGPDINKVETNALVAGAMERVTAQIDGRFGYRQASGRRSWYTDNETVGEADDERRSLQLRRRTHSICP